LLLEILPRVIHDLSWPKTMTWTGKSGARFIRPIRWIVALLGGKVLKFSFGGVAAGDTTAGHRFLGKSKIAVRGFTDYESKLRANGVILRPEERREKISKELAAHAKRGGYHVHEDAELLELVTYLNEYPNVIEGGFDESFLELPDEILITVMRGHQKYFAVEKRGGELARHFLAVINLAKDAKGLVRTGHEKVLRARFADARFFWNSDQRTKLADTLPKLQKVTYESRLGSYFDKVEHVRAIACWLAEGWYNLGEMQARVADADRAAELAKCDLTTEMVGEFSELQGVVGGLYARAQGEPEEVADAVYDHYRPVGLDDPIPRNLTGCAVALADKIADRLKRSLCTSPCGPWHREDYPREESLRVADVLHWRGSQGIIDAPAEEGGYVSTGAAGPRVPSGTCTVRAAGEVGLRLRRSECCSACRKRRYRRCEEALEGTEGDPQDEKF
jgi:glycyl-tRNA synthetase beta chain